MCAGVMVADGRVMPNPDQFPPFDDHRTDRNLARLCGEIRLCECQSHPVRIGLGRTEATWQASASSSVSWSDVRPLRPSCRWYVKPLPRSFWPNDERHGLLNGSWNGELPSWRPSRWGPQQPAGRWPELRLKWPVRESVLGSVRALASEQRLAPTPALGWMVAWWRLEFG